MLNIENLKKLNMGIKNRNMFLRSLFIVFLCMAFYPLAFSQSGTKTKDVAYSLLNNFKFDAISLKYKKTEKYNLWGRKYIANTFLIKSITQRVISFEPTVRGPFKEKYALYVIDDSNGKFKDSLLLFIKDYLKQQEGHYLYPNQIADERNLIIDSLNNFVIYYNTIFDYYYDRFKFNDPEFTLWMNNKIYCFKTIKAGNGFGGISSFIRQNVKIKYNNSFIPIFESGIRWDKFIKLYNEGFFDGAR